MLRDLEIRIRTLKVVLIQSTSEKLNIYCENIVRNYLESTQENVIRVESDKDLKYLKRVSNILPFGSKLWLCLIDIDRVKLDDVIKLANSSHTVFFIFKTKKYFNFKRIKEKFKSNTTFLDLYLAFLRGSDFSYLYDKLVSKENMVHTLIYRYIYQNFNSDIDTVLDIFKFIQEGNKIESKKQIIELWGLGGLTPDKLMMNFLTSKPSTERGFKTSTKQKFTQALELNKEFPWDKMWAYSRKFIRNLCDMKVLYIAGVIYKDTNKVSEPYDVAGIKRASKYLDKLESIPMSKLLRTLSILEKRHWYSDIDFAYFVYEYYKTEIGEDLGIGGKKVGSNS